MNRHKTRRLQVLSPVFRVTLPTMGRISIEVQHHELALVEAAMTRLREELTALVDAHLTDLERELDSCASPHFKY